jgi:hypothetical protein
MAAAKAPKDWVAWHRSYEDPGSSLARRLLVVRREVAAALDRLPAGPVRIVSLCAGDGRDLVPVLARHARRREVDALLVELDQQLVEAADRSIAAESLTDRVVVRRADAGDVSSYRDALPADLLLLCGIFGNVSVADIRRTVAAIPGLVRGGGCVVWTRGGGDPDLRAEIRGMFESNGCREIAFESEADGFGVGVAVVVESTNRVPDGPLFTFEG